MTYLQPLRLKGFSGDMTPAGKPPKTIKGGRLVKLPIVARNKEMAKTGVSSLPNGIKLLKNDDHEYARCDSEEIINLQLNANHGAEATPVTEVDDDTIDFS